MISIHPHRIKYAEEILAGLIQHKQGNFAAAAEVYEKILAKSPRHVVAKYLTALLAHQINEHELALTIMSEVVEQKPDFTEAWYNRGVFLMSLGRYDEADASLNQAIKRGPQFAPSYGNLALVRMAQGRNQEALPLFDRMLELKPDGIEGTHNRSFAHLVLGQWKDGWDDYEWRFQLPGSAQSNPMPNVPRWQGEPLEGKRLIVVAEQGAGDIFMTLRYVPGLVFQGAKVILRVPKALVRIVALNCPQCEVVPEPQRVQGGFAQPDGGPWPACDYHIPFMSLPRAFQTTPDTVPFGDTPYLIAPVEGPDLIAPGFRVGFAWKGSRDHKNDRIRSTRLSDWAPLFAIPGVSWVCLQQEMAPEEEKALRQIRSVAFPGKVTDWADTANLIATKLDACIFVDTGAAHLAGALADCYGESVPVCVLVGASPDWRWMLDRTDTVWYPNTKLYRQQKAGDWSGVFTELAARLRAVIASKQEAAA